MKAIKGTVKIYEDDNFIIFSKISDVKGIKDAYDFLVRIEKPKYITTDMFISQLMKVKNMSVGKNEDTKFIKQTKQTGYNQAIERMKKIGK